MKTKKLRSDERWIIHDVLHTGVQVQQHLENFDRRRIRHIEDTIYVLTFRGEWSAWAVRVR